MPSFGCSSLPFASLSASNAAKTSWNAQPRRQMLPQGQINGFLWVFKPAVCQRLHASKGTPRRDQWLLLGVHAALYHLSPSQRRPWQKTGSHRPFDCLFALSSRHWPHSLCKRGKRKHTLSPSQRCPSQKTGSHKRFKATACEPPNPLHTVLLGLQECQPSNPSTLRSGPTQCFAEASTQDSRLPTFKRVNPPQRPYTLYSWGVTPFAGLQTRTVRSGTTHSVAGGSRVPFASLQTFIQTVKPSAAALHTVLLRLQDHRLLAFNP